MSMVHRATEEDIKKVTGLIERIEFGMLSTVGTDGTIRSRPMATQSIECDKGFRLFFFTGKGSEKAVAVEHDAHVSVAYADPEHGSYVSVWGTGSLLGDREKIRSLWTPVNLAWFPKGPEDPEISLLEVDVEGIEYWVSPSSAFVHVVGFVKALARGRPYRPDQNDTLEFD